MKKMLILLVCFCLIATAVFAEETNPADQLLGQQEKEKELRQKGEQLKEECIQTMGKCDCSTLGDPQAISKCEEAYKIVKQKATEFFNKCFNDIEACSCSEAAAVGPEAVLVCEREKEKYSKQIEAVVLACVDDPHKCDCSVFGENGGECERQVSIGKEVEEKCKDNLDACDCSPIERKEARESCENAKKYAVKFREEFKEKCEKDPMNCDCTTVPSINGMEECKVAKEKAIKQAQMQISAKFDECFASVDNCDCSKMPEESHKKFCEEYLQYGKLCRDNGQFCEKLDEFEILPSGLPDFLKPFFKQTLKAKVEAEKQKGLQQASLIAQQCVMDPEKCDCSKIPLYARGFCQEKKDLQIKCIFEKNVDACQTLDKVTEIVPPNAPAFIKGPLNALLRPLINLQKQQVKGKYAQETKDLIISCIEDVNKCDCSKVPMQYRPFCEGKVEKVKQCYAGDYDMCFKLMDEPNMPEDIPGFIKIFIEGDVNKKVRKQAEGMYKKMRNGKCAELEIDQCRELWKNGELKKEK